MVILANQTMRGALGRAERRGGGFNAAPRSADRQRADGYDDPQRPFPA
jgi:hypothetical protein